MAERARITTIAGVNGAGKSSVIGAWLRQNGGEYFNPDEATRRLLAASSSLTREAANARAWEEGRRRLERAIRDEADFVFETTLGGSTMTELLFEALGRGLEVAIFFVGLPEDEVRERYTASLKNLVRLAPRLSELRVFDNSSDADPKTGRAPEPRELLHAVAGQLISHVELSSCPDWIKPVLVVLLRRS